MTEIIISSQKQKERALLAVSSLPEDGMQCVQIKPVCEDYTSRQRALYWKWCGEISSATGETKEDVHHRLKDKHLRPIYERDDPEGYGAMIQSVRDVWKAGHKAEASAIMRQVVALTSITDTTKKQMSEYMDQIDKECLENGIFLTQPGFPNE